MTLSAKSLHNSGPSGENGVRKLSAPEVGYKLERLVDYGLMIRAGRQYTKKRPSQITDEQFRQIGLSKMGITGET